MAEELAVGYYAAHVVAASIMEVISKDAEIPILFGRMLDVLKIMHDKNSAWQNLKISHPGN